MPNLEELLRLVNEASSRTARIKTLIVKMNAAHEPESDDYGAELMSANLEIAIDHLREVLEMASYLSRPVKETSRLWKNGSGQYETTAGFCFREGSPIEVLVPDSARQAVQFHTVQICAGKGFRQQSEKVPDAAGWFQDVPRLKAHPLHSIVSSPLTSAL